MFNSNFEFTTNLQYQNQSLLKRVASFESSEKYVNMKKDHKSQLLQKNKEIQMLKKALFESNRQIVENRKNYNEVIDDIEKEYEKKLKDKDKELDILKNKLFKMDEAFDLSKAKVRETLNEMYSALTKLEEEKGKNQKLTAQINRDFENSSNPSSLNPNRKKITNSREKTDKKSGGQPGHEGHRRKNLSPTRTIKIPAPKEYEDIKKYSPTGKIIRKQVINLEVKVLVDEYSTPEYRNLQTGQRVHAEFPNGLVNEVTYGASVKAIAFLLNQRCNVSIDKTSEFISDLTNKQVQISKGAISRLSSEVSKKTEAEQKSIFTNLQLSPVMNTDFTGARQSGKNVHVMVCATANNVLFLAREKKGHEGIKGTPVENYQFTLSHDHDITFYSYARFHQECLAHILRYLKDSMENESALTWNKTMHSFIREIIHYRNSLSEDAHIDETLIKKFEIKYSQILSKAKEEYEYEPPSKYYRAGYNLFKRMEKYKENHLLFLHDKRIPTTNNLSERLLRIIKRKQKQSMTFRSLDSLKYFCDCISVIETARMNGVSAYDKIFEVLNS